MNKIKMYSGRIFRKAGLYHLCLASLPPMEPVNFFFFDYSSRGWARLDTT